MDELKIIEEYQNGLSQKDVRKKFGVCQPKLYKLLKKYNITPRGKGKLKRAKKLLNVDLDYFDSIDSHEKAYWLGYLMGDGHITKYKICLTSKDKESIVNFKKVLKSEHKISKVKSYDHRTDLTYTRSMIQINSKHLVEKVSKYGVTQLKSYEAEYPNIDKIYNSSFIRGLFDSDGSICFLSQGASQGARRISIIATDKIIEKVEYILLNDLGIEPIKNSLIKKGENGSIVKMHINKFEYQNKFINYIYENSTPETRLDRKFILSNTPHDIKVSGCKLLSTNKFKILSPNNEIFTVNRISEFAKEHNLSERALYLLRKGGQKDHKGWTKL